MVSHPSGEVLSMVSKLHEPANLFIDLRLRRGKGRVWIRRPTSPRRSLEIVAKVKKGSRDLAAKRTNAIVRTVCRRSLIDAESNSNLLSWVPVSRGIVFSDLSGIGVLSFQVRPKGGHEGDAVHEVDKSIERV